MNLLQQASLVLVFLTLKAGAFTFFLHGKRYEASIIVAPHNLPLGSFTVKQALDAVKKLKNASFPTGITIRIGADDYALAIREV